LIVCIVNGEERKSSKQTRRREATRAINTRRKEEAKARCSNKKQEADDLKDSFDVEC
jgi:hypothetical protein